MGCFSLSRCRGMQLQQTNNFTQEAAQAAK